MRLSVPAVSIECVEYSYAYIPGGMNIMALMLFQDDVTFAVARDVDVHLDSQGKLATRQ